MKLNGKRVNCTQLQRELVAAGIFLPSLGTNGDDLHTYDDSGAIIDVPPTVVPIVLAHVPDPPREHPKAKLKAAMASSSSVAQMKAAIMDWLADEGF